MPWSADLTGPSRPEEHCYAAVTVPSRVESVRLASAFIVQAVRNMGVPAAADPRFEGAIVEALNNAVKHGNAQRPEASVVCEVELVPHRLTVRIFDEGPGFLLPGDAIVAPPEWSAEDVTTVPEGGFGISMIQRAFPIVRTITQPARFGLEMALTF